MRIRYGLAHTLEVSVTVILWTAVLLFTICRVVQTSCLESLPRWPISRTILCGLLRKGEAYFHWIWIQICLNVFCWMLGRMLWMIGILSNLCLWRAISFGAERRKALYTDSIPGQRNSLFFILFIRRLVFIRSRVAVMVHCGWERQTTRELSVCFRTAGSLRRILFSPCCQVYAVSWRYGTVFIW